MASLFHHGSSTKSEGALRVQLCGAWFRLWLVFPVSKVKIAFTQLYRHPTFQVGQEALDTKVSQTAEWNHAIPLSAVASRHKRSWIPMKTGESNELPSTQDVSFIRKPIHSGGK
jgi:hypothetical protein